MKQSLFAAGFAVSLALACPMANAGAGFQDGLWEIASTMELGGMPMPGRPYVQTLCYTATDAADDGKIIPPVGDQECKVTEHQRAGSKLSWKVNCSGTNTGTGTGEIVLGGQSYEGAVMLHTQDARLGPVDMTYKIKARRLGACGR